MQIVLALLVGAVLFLAMWFMVLSVAGASFLIRTLRTVKARFGALAAFIGFRRYTCRKESLALLNLAAQTNGLIVEIGCNEGRTTRDFAKRFPNRKIVAVDYSGNDCAPQATERLRISRLCRFAKGFANVHFVDCDSTSIQFPERIGFAFIDGNHTFEGVRADSVNIEKQMRPGGIIAWHDYDEFAPDWVGVKDYLDGVYRDRLQKVPGTAIAYLRV